MSDDKQAAEVTMAERVERFWRYLETEHVRIGLDLRRGEPGREHWDFSCFNDDVAKALVKERSDHAPTAREADAWLVHWAEIGPQFTRDKATADQGRYIGAKVDEFFSAAPHLAASTVEPRNFMTLVHEYGAKPTQEGYDAIYKRYLVDCGAAPTTSPEPDAVREQIVLDAWKNELPNNRFAWPGTPTEFIRVALAALARNDRGPETERRT